MKVTIEIDAPFPDAALLAGILGTDLTHSFKQMFTDEFAQHIKFSFEGIKSKGVATQEDLYKTFQPELVQFILQNNPRTNPDCMEDESVMKQVLDAANRVKNSPASVQPPSGPVSAAQKA